MFYWIVLLVAALILISFFYQKEIKSYANSSYQYLTGTTAENFGSKTVTLHYTEWCSFCKKMKPVWQQVKNDLGGQVRFIEVDEDKNPTPGITGYPTIVKYDGNYSRYSGEADARKLKQWILQ